MPFAVGAAAVPVGEPIFDTELAIKLGAVGADVGVAGLVGADEAGEDVDEGDLLLLDTAGVPLGLRFL